VTAEVRGRLRGGRRARVAAKGRALGAVLQLSAPSCEPLLQPSSASCEPLLQPSSEPEPEDELPSHPSSFEPYESSAEPSQLSSGLSSAEPP
jgi:hypothetical protein